ncbi:cAMP phosphodiesterases class-II-domain-containing protein, partial [Pyronema omphalodes]
EPAFQVIVLGSGGGPAEGNVSGYLIRSTATNWSKNSVLAVDAGTHLSGIIKILEENDRNSKILPADVTSNSTKSNDITDFAFAGAPLPHENPTANASHILRTLISTYLITHSHLDHISGLIINTASFTDPSNPKKLAALPHVITSLKTHIFNDVIWPNLSNEENGVGLVAYQRLQAASTYVPVSEGLTAQVWPVSHGNCMKKHTHWGRKSTAGLEGIESAQVLKERWCVVDSAVFFIRDKETGAEAMMWGDVEPDSVSHDPRNSAVWREAARKIVMGSLRAVFIECSYDDSQPDNCLYGHLSPRHLIAELEVLAGHVKDIKAAEAKGRQEKLKRKRVSADLSLDSVPEVGERAERDERWETDMSDISPKCRPVSRSGLSEIPRLELPGMAPMYVVPVTTSKEKREWKNPLKGLKIVITHVKDTMTGVDVAGKVLEDLKMLEKDTNLGCEFLLARQSEGIYF